MDFKTCVDAAVKAARSRVGTIQVRDTNRPAGRLLSEALIVGQGGDNRTMSWGRRWRLCRYWQWDGMCWRMGSSWRRREVWWKNQRWRRWFETGVGAAVEATQG